MTETTPVRFVIGIALAAVVVVGNVPAAAESPSAIMRISTNGSNSQIAKGGATGDMSPNGRWLVFSTRSRLVPEDNNGLSDVYRKDLTNGGVELVSVAKGGGSANGSSGGGMHISGDGQVVTFESEATNLTDDEFPNMSDVLGSKDRHAFARDMRGDQVVLVGVNLSGEPTEGSRILGLSPSGREVLYAVDFKNPLLRDLTRGTSSYAATDSSGTPLAAFSAKSAVFSDDGRHIVAGGDGGVGGGSDNDIYVYNRANRSTRRISIPNPLGNFDGRVYEPQMSSDRWVVFWSDSSRIVPGDRNGRGDVFLHDLVTSDTSRVSVASDGGESAVGADSGASVSADGTKVVFAAYPLETQNTAESLGEAKRQVFLHNRLTGTTRMLSVNAAGEPGNDTSGGLSISPDGNSAYFNSTSTDLVANDTNGANDVFLIDLTKISRFGDVNFGNVFTANIERLADAGITKGCNPPTNDQFCPDDYVTRAQMAAFLDRALGLPNASERFVDVSSSNVFSGNIGALAGSGITRGCNPPDNTRFCPDDFVTRGQMAAFLDRALDLPDAPEQFTDVAAGNVFGANIGALAGSGITKGCNPPSNDRFCPDDFVTRAQMAAFLDRAGLTG